MDIFSQLSDSALRYSVLMRRPSRGHISLSETWLPGIHNTAHIRMMLGYSKRGMWFTPWSWLLTTETTNHASCLRETRIERILVSRIKRARSTLTDVLWEWDSLVPFPDFHSESKGVWSLAFNRPGRRRAVEDGQIPGEEPPGTAEFEY